ncbi:AAA family ATPase [Salimicrobium halophilum]|uniref:Predicted ATPase n=1 Tax=Salimicrobium halophilum TaxID=86666 RepID=A0A1G8RAC1_9BACI|nr:AAA family ATPase [Salimicrobium halophilum]SDJ13916.1 Predicted ATPase [Salimicrobium halophilum]
MSKRTQDNQYIKRITLKEKAEAARHYFPLNLPLFQSFQEMEMHPNVTFVVGENGSGKSTFLEAVAVALGFNPEGGTKNFNFSTYDSHSDLHEYLRVARGPYRPQDSFFFRAETFYNVATHIEELDRGPGGGRIIDSYGGTSLHEQSHGESFFAAFMERFGGEGLYILDEPEAALSPLRQISMLSRMDELVRDGSQFLISTHSPLLTAYPHAAIYQISEEGMEKVKVEETEHYQVMSQFFEDRERLFHHLFEGEGES